MHSKTLNIFATSLFIALASIALFSFLLFLVVRNNEALRTLEIALGVEVIEEREYLSERALLRDTLKERTEIDRRIVRSDTVALFLEDIEELGIVSDVEVNVGSVNIRETSKDAVTSILDVSVTVFGDWKSVFHYLLLLESMPVALTVEESTLTVAGRTEEGLGQWRGVFDISVLITP